MVLNRIIGAFGKSRESKIANVCSGARMGTRKTEALQARIAIRGVTAIWYSVGPIKLNKSGE